MTHSMNPKTCSTRLLVLDFSLLLSFVPDPCPFLSMGCLSWRASAAAPLRQTMSGILSLCISAWLFFLNYNYITKDLMYYYLTIKLLSIFRGVLIFFPILQLFIHNSGVLFLLWPTCFLIFLEAFRLLSCRFFQTDCILPAFFATSARRTHP